MVSIEEQHPNAEYRSSVSVFGLSFVVVIEQVGGSATMKLKKVCVFPAGAHTSVLVRLMPFAGA
jgi:hypothetical protein